MINISSFMIGLIRYLMLLITTREQDLNIKCSLSVVSLAIRTETGHHNGLEFIELRRNRQLLKTQC